MRLFAAVWPSSEVVETLAELSRPDVPGLRWTSPDQWHVTLRFLGECDPDEARAALDAAVADAAVATMGPVTGRFGNRILHVPVAGLDDVAAAVIDATVDVGEPVGDRVFSGHITLGRVRETKRHPPVDLRKFTGERLIGEWRVTDVTLVQSRLGPGGARYEVIASKPLRSG